MRHHNQILFHLDSFEIKAQWLYSENHLWCRWFSEISVNLITTACICKHIIPVTAHGSCPQVKREALINLLFNSFVLTRRSLLKVRTKQRGLSSQGLPRKTAPEFVQTNCSSKDSWDEEHKYHVTLRRTEKQCSILEPGLGRPQHVGPSLWWANTCSRSCRVLVLGGSGGSQMQSNYL